MAFAIKADIPDPRAMTFVFPAQKTMYGGKQIREGDTIFIFASETTGGHGLVARGIVAAAEAVPRTPGVARQTPRVNLSITRTALARRPLGRDELKPLTNWNPRDPGAEMHFKFYRQTTSKIVGLSDQSAAFIATFF